MSYNSKLEQTNRRVAKAKRKYYGSFDYGSGIRVRSKGGTITFGNKFDGGGTVSSNTVQNAATAISTGITLGKGAYDTATSNLPYSEYEKALRNQAAAYDRQLFGATDNSSLLSALDSQTYFNEPTNSTFNSRTAGDRVVSLLGAAGAGAAAGSMIAPGIGTAIGAIGGLAIQGIGEIAQGLGVKKSVRKGAALTKDLNTSLETKRAKAATAVDTLNDLNRQRAFMNTVDYAAFGGPISHGSDFSNGLSYINVGGTHEQNPNEGVPVGVDEEGIPNLVEQGEVIWDNDYVFSNRTKVPKKLANKYGLGGDITFADAIKEVTKESEMRPNDPISNITNKAIVEEFMQAQEEIRQDDQRKAARELQQAQDMQFMDMLANPSVQGYPQEQGMQMPVQQPYQEPYPMQDEEMMPPGYAKGGHLFYGGGATERQNAYQEALKRYREIMGEEATEGPISPIEYMTQEKLLRPLMDQVYTSSRKLPKEDRQFLKSLADRYFEKNGRNDFSVFTEDELSQAYDLLERLYNEATEQYKSTGDEYYKTFADSLFPGGTYDRYLSGMFSEDTLKYNKYKDAFRKENNITADPETSDKYRDSFYRYMREQDPNYYYKNLYGSLDDDYNESGNLKELPESYQRAQHSANLFSDSVDITDTLEPSIVVEERPKPKTKVLDVKIPETRLSEFDYDAGLSDENPIDEEYLNNFTSEQLADLMAGLPKPERKKTLDVTVPEVELKPFEEPEFDTNKLDRENNRLIRRMQRMIGSPYDIPASNVNWEREAPILASGLMAAYGLTGSPDYSNVNPLFAEAEALGTPVSIPIETIGDYVQARPFDERYLVNQATQARNAAYRGAMSTSGGNRAMQLGAQSYLAGAYQNNLADIMRQSYLANRDDYYKTSEFNRGTNVQNMTAINARNLAQAQLNSGRQQSRYSALAGAYAAKQGVKDTWDNTTQQSLNTFIENIGARGREKTELDRFMSILDAGYVLDYDPKLNRYFFTPKEREKEVSEATSARGGKLRKKRRF